MFPTSVPWERPLLLLAAGLVLLFGRRAALAPVAVFGWILTNSAYNHLLFGFWTISTWALFGDPDQRRLVHRAQLSILYGFAGLAKLTPRWLSGTSMQTILRDVTLQVEVPLEVAAGLAVAAAATEITLAVGVWLPAVRRPVLLLGAGLHVGLAMQYGSYEPPLVLFNGLAMLWLVDATRVSTAAAGSAGQAA